MFGCTAAVAETLLLSLHYLHQLSVAPCTIAVEPIIKDVNDHIFFAGLSMRKHWQWQQRQNNSKESSRYWIPHLLMQPFFLQHHFLAMALMMVGLPKIVDGQNGDGDQNLKF